MLLPVTTQNLIEDTLQQIQQDPTHQLNPMQRLQIYISFGPSNRPKSIPAMQEQMDKGQLDLAIADLALAQLAIITAEFVLPIWQQAEPAMLAKDDSIPVDMPETILIMAKGILQGSFNPRKQQTQWTAIFIKAWGLWHTKLLMIFGVLARQLIKLQLLHYTVYGKLNLKSSIRT